VWARWNVITTVAHTLKIDAVIDDAMRSIEKGEKPQKQNNGEYFMDRLTKQQRSKCMSHIRSKDTGIEVLLRKTLWHRGYRYRKNYKLLPGKPDIVLTKQRVVIFCDSEFWHGKDWRDLKARLLKGKNPDYWIRKIERNIARDAETDKKLLQMDWTVIRFWGKEILKDTEGCIQVIEEAIFERKIQQIDDSENTNDSTAESLY